MNKNKCVVRSDGVGSVGCALKKGETFSVFSVVVYFLAAIITLESVTVSSKQTHAIMLCLTFMHRIHLVFKAY